MSKKAMRVLPEEMRATAGNLGGLSGDTSQVQHRLRRNWGRLDSGWQSYTRGSVDGHYRKAMREVDRMAAMLEQMGQALHKTADLIEEADQAAVGLFGEMSAPEKESPSDEAPYDDAPPVPPSPKPPLVDKSALFDKSSAGKDGEPWPTNMQDLARRVMTLDYEHPIEIVQIGANEYVILFRGTVLKPGAPHNWAAALQSGLGQPGDYELQARDLILQHVPEGATLHFAGHSQGGIVANNLADNQDFLDRYDLATVTTFGAPQSSMMNPDVDYYRYAAIGDPTPAANRFALVAGPLGLPVVLGAARLAELNQTQVYSGEYDPHNIGDAHASYKYAPGLAQAPLPFTVTQWDGESHSVQPPTHSMASGFDQILYGDSGWDRLGGGIDFLWGGYVSYKLSRIDTNVEIVSFLFPEPIRDSVDRYWDRTSEAWVMPIEQLSGSQPIQCTRPRNSEPLQ
jgi:WXG100 family type VII secretion target